MKGVTWNVNEQWASVTPGSRTGLELKEQLRQGDRPALNIYAGNIGGGVLGWAYFPQDTESKNRAALDGVVMIDESMPGGATKWHSEGDTGTHEVGHWLGLCSSTARTVTAAWPLEPTRSTTSWTTPRTTSWTTSPSRSPNG